MLEGVQKVQIHMTLKSSQKEFNWVAQKWVNFDENSEKRAQNLNYFEIFFKIIAFLRDFELFLNSNFTQKFKVVIFLSFFELLVKIGLIFDTLSNSFGLL
jgi:hypothetical protein